MPELPEVEHQSRFLNRVLVGRRIERAEADATPLLKGKTTARSFAKAITGRTVIGIERRGKFLLIHFDEGVVLLCHLGMSGKWVRRTLSDPLPRHLRASLYLQGDEVLRYIDQRMLGRLEITDKPSLPKREDLRSLGVDPLRDGLEAPRLGALLATTKRPVKVALMDASLIAGLGNIQATEALFRAHVHPQRPASSLAKDEIAALAKGITETIEHTLAAHADEDEIVYLSEKKAGVKNPFLVYGRASEPCPRCGRAIVVVPIATRTSAFCPRCQPATRSAPRRDRG